MSDDTVISVKGVSKAYRIWHSPGSRLTAPVMESAAGMFSASSSLSRYLKLHAARRYRDFWALRDINLEVKRGESVGIIGRNGSGKSTLLQIIAGTLRPTTGNVHVKGRVAALLELGSGFNPEFTGRENVYLNGAVLGLSRQEMDVRFNQIAAFADIGDFVDQPVKIYSSGMLMRLAFAVQTAVDPEVLVIDEAMAVGDAPFQAKCFARMRELVASGVAILFVSHDVGTVRTLCQHALCLAQGQTVSQGTAKRVCDDYQVLCMREQGIISGQVVPFGEPSPATAVNYHKLHGPRNADFAREAARQRSGSGRIRIIDCFLADPDGRPVSLVEYNAPIVVCWLLEAAEPAAGEISLGLCIKNLKGIELLSGTDKDHDLTLDLQSQQRVLVTMPYSLPLRADKYYLTTSVFAFPAGRKYLHGVINFDDSELLDLVEYSCYFEVNWNRRWAVYGPVQLDAPITIVPIGQV